MKRRGQKLLRAQQHATLKSPQKTPSNFYKLQITPRPPAPVDALLAYSSMASPQPPPAVDDDFFQRVLSVPVGPVNGGLGFPLGFSSVAEDRNPAAKNSYPQGFKEFPSRSTEVKCHFSMVLSMSGLGGAAAVSQLFAETPPQLAEEKAGEAENEQYLWNNWLNDETEGQAVKLMIEDIDVAVQFLRSKVLCSVPITIAAAIYHSHHQQPQPPLVKIPDPNAPS